MFAFREEVTEGEGARLGNDGRSKSSLCEEWAIEDNV